jgi:hypothetical protein
MNGHPRIEAVRRIVCQFPEWRDLLWETFMRPHLHGKRLMGNILSFVATKVGTGTSTLARAFAVEAADSLFRRFEAICISMEHRIVNEATCREYIFSLLPTLYASSKNS